MLWPILPNWGFQAPYLVFVKADEAVWATTPANNFKVSVEGDSIAQGGYFGQNFARWLIEHEIMDLLGFSRCINTGIGGTSCTNLTNGGKTLSTQGSASTVNTTFGERIRFITESGIPDIHVIFGFHNEVNNYQTAGLLARRKAILQYMQDCRAAWPNALIVVLPFAPLTGDSYTTGGSQSLFDLEADVFNQFTTFGDANSLFIPTQSASFPFYSTASASTTSWYHSAGGPAPYNDSHPVTRFYPVFARVIADAIRRFYQI